MLFSSRNEAEFEPQKKNCAESELEKPANFCNASERRCLKTPHQKEIGSVWINFLLTTYHEISQSYQERFLNAKSPTILRKVSSPTRRATKIQKTANGSGLPSFSPFQKLSKKGWSSPACAVFSSSASAVDNLGSQPRYKMDPEGRRSDVTKRAYETHRSWSVAIICDRLGQPCHSFKLCNTG